MTRIQAKCLPEFANCLIEVAPGQKTRAETVPRSGTCRLDSEGLFKIGRGLAILSGYRNGTIDSNRDRS